MSGMARSRSMEWYAYYFSGVVMECFVLYSRNDARCENCRIKIPIVKLNQRQAFVPEHCTSMSQSAIVASPFGTRHRMDNAKRSATAPGDFS
jgi:hypothetical protein